MALQLIGPTLWPWYTPTVNFIPGTFTIDAADEIAAGVFTVAKTGTVVRIHFSTGTVITGTTVEVRLETVDASNGQPSGTLFGTNTSVSHVIADTDDAAWLRTSTLTGSANVTAGDRLAVVVKNPNTSFGNMQIRRAPAIPGPPGLPYAVGPLASNKGDQAPPLICALEYDDGSFSIPPLTLPVSSTSGITLSTSSNPDEIATYFTPTVPMRVIGWWATMTLASGANCRIQIYTSGNDTPVASDTVDSDLTTSAGSRFYFSFFPATVTLSAGTTYRIAVLPTTTNNVTVQYFDVSSSYLGLLDCLPGGQAMHYSSRNRSSTTDPDAAAWSQTTNRRLGLGLIVDQFDDGAGGSSSTRLIGGVLAG